MRNFGYLIPERIRNVIDEFVWLKNSKIKYLSKYYKGEMDDDRGKSWLIPVIILVNVIVFVTSIFLNDCPKNNFGNCVPSFFGRFSFQPFRQNSMLGPSDMTLDRMGALEWNKIVDKHQWWRLLTCIWLHAGLPHLLANMSSVFLTGVRLEQLFGFARVGAIYLLSGVGGNILSLLIGPHNIYVGASSCLLGLSGAMLSEIITNWTIFISRAATLFALGIFVTLNLSVGRFLPHVDNFGHIGGFFTGFLLGFILLLRPQLPGKVDRHCHPHDGLEPKIRPHQHILAVIALISLIVGFTAGLVLVLRGVSGYRHCSWCHYLSD